MLAIPNEKTHNWCMDALTSLQDAILYFSDFENCRAVMVRLPTFDHFGGCFMALLSYCAWPGVQAT